MWYHESSKYQLYIDNILKSLQQINAIQMPSMSVIRPKKQKPVAQMQVQLMCFVWKVKPGIEKVKASANKFPVKSLV